MVQPFKNIFKRNSPEQMRSAKENAEKALLKLDSCHIDDQVKKILRDRFQETTERYEKLCATHEVSETSDNGAPSPEVPLSSPDAIDTCDPKVLSDIINTEDGGSVVWKISTPPDDPIPISLSFRMDSPVEEKDVPTIMMVAGDEVVATAVEKALEQRYKTVLQDAEIRDYFAESFDRLDAQRRKMDSYETSEAAFDIACRLYFADAFGFLRRVMLVLEIAAPHGTQAEGGETVRPSTM